MLRALTVALLCASTVASAEKPAAEDPKVAIADRGIVLRAGKRNFVVIVPSGTANKLEPGAKIYFGTAKSLSSYGVSSYTAFAKTDYEQRGLADERNLHAPYIERTGDRFSITCTPQWEGPNKGKLRRITLAPAAPEDIERAVVVDREPLPKAFLLARVPKTTTYLYVDARNDKEHRVFMGKRGAMKPLAITEMVDDASSTVFVTPKGALTIVPGRTRDEPPTVTFGSAKKPVTLEPIPVHTEWKLIYFDLGVYIRERSGHPCDEL